MWVSMPSERHDDDEIVEMNQYLDHFLPRGNLYEHMIRRIISSDDLGFVLMGVFKVSDINHVFALNLCFYYIGLCGCGLAAIRNLFVEIDSVIVVKRY